MLSDKATVFQDGRILLFDKPLYWTSFDLVNKIRIIIKSGLGIKDIKVGHAGTLDPLASGLMILCTGKATKRIDEFRDMEKEYVATFHIGETTSSFDLETEINNVYPTDHITEDFVKITLEGFLGEQRQVPPMHSAKQINGKRAYEYARKGIEKELEPVTVFFREIELISYGIPETKIRFICSKGTYIRSFARDFGQALGSGAYLSSLERTAIGSFQLKDAYSIEYFQKFVEELKQN